MHTKTKEIEAGFWVLLFHGPCLLHGCPYDVSHNVDLDAFPRLTAYNEQPFTKANTSYSIYFYINVVAMFVMINGEVQ